MSIIISKFIYNLGLFFNFEGKTSGLKNLQLDAAFAAIPIDDVSESTQNKIVAVLQDLEKKITINRRINQNLCASRAQSQTQFELCRGAAVNAGLRTKSARTELAYRHLTVHQKR